MSTILLKPRATVLGDTLAKGVNLLVQDGLIAAIGQEMPQAERELELDGVVLPGLIDLQVNGGAGHSADEANPEALNAIARCSREGGAAAFLPTLISAPMERMLAQTSALADWIEAFDESRPDLAIPLGIHLEGPFLEAQGAHQADSFVDPTPDRIDALIRAGRGQVRLVTLAPGRDGAPAAIHQLREAGVSVSIGHGKTTDGLAACVDAGARLATHLYNAMGPIHHRRPGLAGLVLDETRLTCSLILDGAHVHPAMVRNAWRCLGAERTILITDAVSAAGMPDGDYRIQGDAVHLTDGVVRNERGALAGSALTMTAAIRQFLEILPEAGPATLARIAAANPARAIDAESWGDLAVGKRALLTFLDADGQASFLDLA